MAIILTKPDGSKREIEPDEAIELTRDIPFTDMTRISLLGGIPIVLPNGDTIRLTTGN